MPSSSGREQPRKKQVQTSISSFLSSSKQLESRNPTSSPELPEATQAMLISVGMRVRKSVPEGYKTHLTGLQSSQQPCGLHKVGGFGQQADMDDEEMSSQDTVSSHQSRISTTSNVRKRCFEEELDEEGSITSDQLDRTLLDSMVDLTEDSSIARADRPIAKAKDTVRKHTDFEEASFLRSRDQMEID